MHAHQSASGMQNNKAIKLRPSPSSVSSHSNASSLFKDDGFEDDFASTGSESASHWVVAEIVETERTYVDDLEQIVFGYIKVLRRALKKDQIITQHNQHNSEQQPQPQQQSTQPQTQHHTIPKPTISEASIKNLFSNLEDIYKFNKELLYRLEECYRNPSSIAECFVEHATGFEIYTHYCTMYPLIVSTLTELMSDQASAEILRQRQSALQQPLPLGSYLLKPVQRILKYHILFQSLIKHIADDDSIREKDKQHIDEAYSVMTNVACHINEMKKKHEHAVRVQEIQSLLLGWPEGPDLTTMGELIVEDSIGLYNKPKTSRHLFLFDNVLLITKKKRDGSLCYKGHIPCSNLMLIEMIEGEPLVFHAVPFDSPKTLFAFQAKNLEQKRDWCIQMKDVIIKSFQVKIPNHVKDILMSLTSNTETSAKTSGGKLVKVPDYLQKKRASLPKRR